MKKRDAIAPGIRSALSRSLRADRISSGMSLRDAAIAACITPLRLTRIEAGIVHPNECELEILEKAYRSNA
jgi:transcriptional regulator with XRE-family HTH domain